jgi:hypothetical protein
MSIAWIEWFNYLFVLVVGLMVGFINTLAGSGSLLTLPLLIWLGLDPLTANGTNSMVELNIDLFLRTDASFIFILRSMSNTQFLCLILGTRIFFYLHK